MRGLPVGVAAVVLSACLVPVDEGPTRRVDAGVAGIVLGPDGGLITLGGGLSLSFPPNAVGSTLSIGVETFSGGPSGRERLSPGFQLSPEGQQFERAVTVHFDATGIPSSRRLLIATAPRGSTQFELLPMTRTNDTAIGFVWHFSTVQIVGEGEDGGVDAGSSGGRDSGTGCGPLPTDISGLDAGPGCKCRPLGAPCFDTSDCAEGFCLVLPEPPASYGRVCSVYCSGDRPECPCGYQCLASGSTSIYLCIPPAP